MKKMIVLNDCTCQGDEYEMFFHWREGLRIKSLKKGEIVEFVKTWSNFYGNYDRIKKNNEDYDIKSGNLENYNGC